MHRLLLAAAAVMAAFFVTPAAEAQAPCAPRNAVVERLGERGLAVVASGLDSRGVVIEVLADPDGRWVIHMVRPDGIACLLMSGEGFSGIAAEAMGPEA